MGSCLINACLIPLASFQVTLEKILTQGQMEPHSLGWARTLVSGHSYRCQGVLQLSKQNRAKKGPCSLVILVSSCLNKELMGNECLQCAQQSMKIFPQRLIPTTAPWNRYNYPHQGGKGRGGVGRDMQLVFVPRTSYFLIYTRSHFSSTFCGLGLKVPFKVDGFVTTFSATMSRIKTFKNSRVVCSTRGHWREGLS